MWFNLDAGATVALIFVVVFGSFAASALPIVLPYIDVDAAYFLDVIFNAQHAGWLSRDVTFTYGPLYEGLWAWSSHIHGLSVGSFFRFGSVLPFCFTALAIFAVTHLLLRGYPSWKRALYIVALLYSWSYFEVRHATVLLLFALSVYELDRTARNAGQTWRAALIALLLATTFLCAADAGMYSVTAFALTVVSSLIVFRSDRAAELNILRFTVIVLAFLAAWVVIIGAVFGRQFWVDTLAIISTYRWSLAKAIAPKSQAFLFKVAIVTAVIFVIGWIRRDPESPRLARRPLFLLCAPLFSLVYLQSSIVRADWAHVVFGLFPAMAFSAAILLGSDRPRAPWLLNTFPALLGFALLAHYTTPHPRFVIPFVRAKIVAAIQARSFRGKNICPPSTSNLDGICFPASEFEKLDSVSRYLAEHTLPSDSVFSFPLENIYAIAARRSVGGGVLQNYLAVGDTLVQRKLQLLEKDKPLLAVYSLDRPFIGLDARNTITRDPEIWFYLQSHYRIASEIQPDVLVLQRDPTRSSRWKMETTELPTEPSARSVNGQRVSNFVVSDQFVWPADADFIGIKVLVRYPLLWRLRKPCRILVDLDLANGTTASTIAVVPPNHETEIWISPWGGDHLKKYFSPDMLNWHTHDLSPPVRVRMEMAPMDWISEKPLTVNIQKLEAVRLSLGSEPLRSGAGSAKSATCGALRISRSRVRPHVAS